MPKDIDGWLLRQYSVTGEERYFEALASGYWEKIIGWVIGRVGCRHSAEDVAQNVLLQVHLKAHTFRQQSSFSTWLYVIAMNQVKDWRRHRLALRRSHPMDGGEFDIEDPLPDNGVEISELSTAVLGLPEIYREVILLVVLDGMLYQQAADTIAVPVGTIRSRLHRAVSLLRQRMAA